MRTRVASSSRRRRFLRAGIEKSFRSRRDRSLRSRLRSNTFLSGLEMDAPALGYTTRRVFNSKDALASTYGPSGIKATRACGFEAGQ